ncbi:MAG: DHH family phosphoesterase [Candidatus Thermoplasmatota archaeon]|jgi:single-stranded DNA-specific DHH superfamily exonuclease|nr:DHH family phosphoesterase [Candidatus Thermoplasmatota archaeon]
MLKELKGKGLIIHHWDTDGICSAHILLKHLSDKNIINKTPQLGNYYLTEEELNNYSKYDFIILLDMSLPISNVLKLAKNANVMIFDHHLGKEIEEMFHYNPVIKGENPDKYPSTSWIINDYVGNKTNLYALLGVVGDHEQKIINNTEFYQKITNFCKQNNLEFDDMLKMVYLLDSNYKINDKKAVELAPHQLKNNLADSILNNKKWNENLAILDEEIKKIISTQSDEIDEIIFKKISTPYNIISTITRKIAWETGKNTIVVNTGFFKDSDQIYLRSNKDASPIIQKGKSLGYRCGGKKEVLGAVVPKQKTDSFIEEIIKFLKT